MTKQIESFHSQPLFCLWTYNLHGQNF